MTANEFTVSFSLPGYQPQTVPVRVVASADGSDAEGAAPRAEPGVCRIAARPRPPPVAKKPAPAKKKPKPAPRAGADRHGARAAPVAGPRAGLALAAGALKQRSISADMPNAAADGRPHSFCVP